MAIDGRGFTPLYIYIYSAREFSEKTSIYSTLVGILNARKFDIGNEVGVAVALVTSLS